MVYAENIYTPRNAEDNPLYQTVAKNLKTFLADQQHATVRFHFSLSVKCRLSWIAA